MSKHSGGGTGSKSLTIRTQKPAGMRARRLGFEALEQRQLLTVAAPTTIVFQPQTGQGTATLTSANNTSQATALEFLVSGVTAGNTVKVYVDGGTTAFGSGTVAVGATTITVSSNRGSGPLSNGPHSFTATQTDTSTPAVTSASSPADPLQVFNSVLATATSARVLSAPVGQVFTYKYTLVQSSVPSGDTVTTTPGATLPTGMTYDATTQTFTWTPTADQAGTTQSFTETLTDIAGNSTALPVFVAVTVTSGVSVLAPPANIAIGSPVLVAMNSADAGTPTFSVTTSDSHLTATVMPQTNQVLKIVTDQGEMDLQLLNNYTPTTVAHFISLVNSSTYTNTTFYRIIQTFMNQGGSGGTGSPIPVELNGDLRFTSSGLLAMANNGVDGNSSEFFITNPNDMNNAFLDFRYTIFGKLIAGDNVRQAIAATPVTTNSSGENSQPVTAPKILSMSVTTETASGAFLLKALPGAAGSYTVTVTDGLGGSHDFTITVGANSYDPPNPWVAPINGTDTISTPVNTAVTFTPQGRSADGTAVQVNVQLLRPVPTIPTAFVDYGYTGTNPPADATNPNVTLTQNGSSYTLTPTAGYQGVQYLEVTAVTPVSGTFSLKVGTVTTGSINFDSTNPATTATNIKNALVTAGFSGATVSVSSANSPLAFGFNVAFTGSESPVSYVAASTALPITFANSVTAAAASQGLTFTATGPAWDSTAGVNPAYRAFVPVFIGSQAPAAPRIASISVGGTAVSGSTFANNTSTATELSFSITGAVAGDTISVYMDGGATPIAQGSAASGATTATLTTDGKTKLADGSHQFTVKQATPEVTLYADWTTTLTGQSPGVRYSVPASSIDSPASAGTALTIGLTVLAPPAGTAQVGVPYTYVVKTNAPSGDTVTVTPGSLPSGMQFNGVDTFTWTPTSAQQNTAPAFSAQLSDTQSRTTSIGPVNISVIVGLPPIQVPLNSTAGGNVTVSFSGSQIVVYDNIGKALLSQAAFKATDAITISLPAGQANSVSVVLPAAGAAIPKELLVQGVSGATNNQVAVLGTSGANTFALAGNTVTANGLATQITAVQKFTLNGGGGSDYYRLDSSSVPTAIVDKGGYNTLDFSHDTAGVTVNLGLYKGQAQTIAPWNTTLSITAAINDLIGSQFADVLTGGPAAVTEIRGGLGNNTITGGSGDNIILGGGGNSTINGGTGRNLIIAGAGACTIYANGWQNMVVGGTTNYDSNDQALMNLLDQGPRFMYGYSFRRALASAAVNSAVQSGMLSFHDNGAADKVFGSSNINNWYILGKYDTVKS